MERKGLNSYQLKWIAIITMLTDHVGAVLFPEYQILRGIGRISFPIFCFLLVEGFHYTHDWKKYFLRLFAFAWISEIPFDLAFFGTWYAPQHQNVFFTLALGILMMYVLKRHETLLLLNRPGMMLTPWLIAAIMTVSVLMKTDYSIKGLYIILIFYLLRNNRMAAVWLVGGFELLLGYIYPNSNQWFAILAMIPVLCYNEKQGKKMKYFFYLFYPIHLLILWGIWFVR